MYKRYGKRFLDFCLSILLVLILLPLFLVLSLIIKFTSKGPIFFLHERVGLGGKLFKVIKFRTFYSKSCGEGSSLTTGEDSRVTRAGKVLREYRLDELPQFLNVIKGEMSLVGPRPEVSEFVLQYPEREKSFILSVRPGITGRTQLSFLDEGELLKSADEPERFYIESILPKKIASDFAYAQSLSLQNDLAILLKTAFQLMGYRKAEKIDDNEDIVN